MLAEAGVPIEPLVDRDALLRELFPEAAAADRGRLDLAFSRLKLDLRVTADDVAGDPAAGPDRERVRRLRAGDRGARRRRLRRPRRPRARAPPGRCAHRWPRWRARCAQLLVDEAQDLDRTQLELALLLAAPANDVFLVGDDDQSIYGWRLADVRRVLGLAALAAGPATRRPRDELPVPAARRGARGAPRRAQPRAFREADPAGTERARAGWSSRPTPPTTSCASRARSRTWPADASTRAILARTNRELLVAVVAALDLGIPFRAPDLPLPIEDDRIDGLLDRAVAVGGDGGRRTGRRCSRSAGCDGRSARRPPRAATTRATPDIADGPTPVDLAGSLLGWAAPLPTLEALRSAIAARRQRLAELRRDDAALSLATAHGTKGLEWDHVIVLADGFPGRRSVSDAAEPERALEEERRLAYVAWTRARRSLTLLYDPQAPSRFLLEAFSRDELGLSAADAAA